MVIDSHQHLWTYQSYRFPWITDDMKVLQRDFLPEESVQLMAGNQVDAAIVVQAMQTEEETRFLLRCASKTPEILGVVGWTDLKAADAAGNLDRLAREGRLLGIRHMVQDEADDGFMLRGDFQKGVGLLEARGLCYDLLIYPRHLPAAVGLVRAFPGQRFVLDHLAKPKISEAMDPAWIAGITALARFPNVACKVSGLVTETEDFRWVKEAFYPFLDVVFGAFGTDRVLYGSDWPVCLLAATYQEVLDIMSCYLIAFSAEEREMVLGQNAKNWYLQENIKQAI